MNHAKTRRFLAFSEQILVPDTSHKHQTAFVILCTPVLHLYMCLFRRKPYPLPFVD